MPMEKNFDAAEAEARIAREWEAAGAFRAGANAKPGAEAFSIVIPPPNVTGNLHMGHAFNNTLQDILTRWHRMRGFDTLWQPGQDHAGIATQMVVERELAKDGSNKTRREMGREAFVEKVWEWKEKSGGTIIGQLKRLGASCDWDRNRFTMDEGFHDAVMRVFVQMYNDGLIYRGKRLVNWDPHFETAISDLEVENIEVDGFMWHFKYPLAGGATYEYVERDDDGNETLRETRDYISIATTRPETMLGDGAVAVHPSDTRYAPIVGMLCEIPVGPKEHRRRIPIITDEYPDPKFGSGAVKITGAHDFNDYGVAMRNGIPLYALMDGRAKMRTDGLSYAESAAIATRAAAGEDVGDVSAVNLVPEELRGLDRMDARARVVEAITAEGLAVTDAEGAPVVEKKKITQPFGDRSKVVIEPMLTDQWFVDTKKIVQPAIDAVRDGRTKILPEQHEKVYFHWLENIEPWTISRQLWWGHQIPVWYGPTKEALSSVSLSGDRSLFTGIVEPERGKSAGVAEFCAPTEAACIAQAQRYYGDQVQVVIGTGESDVSRYGKDSTGRSYISLQRDPDVLDTWFSSGLWPIGTLGWPEDTPEMRRYFPTDTLVTGFDIIFFWVARMMMMQLAVVKEIPFRTVYVHALVRDAKGKKMSKSLGNVIDPIEVIDQYGADALRFTLTSMAAMGRDLKLSDDRVAGYRNFVTKIWNATRFAEMNGVRGGGDRPQPAHTVNRWIIGELARTRIAVDEALTAYRFNDAANTLYAFTWGKLCDWYVEAAKPLFDGEAAEETRATMGWVMDQTYALLHPFMPFVTEELWRLTGERGAMLVVSDWPEAGADLIDPAADREMNWVIGLIDAVRSARAQLGVPAGAKLDLIVTEADEAARAALAANAPLIQRLARVNAPRDGAPGKGTIAVAAPGASFALPVGEVIDAAAESARLQKAADKITKDAGGLRGRLSNPKFVENAEAEVIEETREKLAALDEELARTQGALDQLAAL